MIPFKAFYHETIRRIRDYNIFIREENDYDDENPTNEREIVKEQKYATWLYILLLFISIYILFFANLIQHQQHTIVISNITLNMFKKLSFEYDKTLLCPCSNINIPQKNFIDHIIKFHPVCSSIFVSEQWINSLYLRNASIYGTNDFRSTAYSQFRLLSDLCSFSREITDEIEKNFNNDEIITDYLLSENQLESKVNKTIEFLRKSLSVRINLFLNYLRSIILGNFLVSALNTNYLLTIVNSLTDPRLASTDTCYVFRNDLEKHLIGCSHFNSVGKVSFDNLSDVTMSMYYDYLEWRENDSNDSMVDGFYTSCLPFEGLLQSTLDCLYEYQCIELLMKRFRNIIKMNINWNNSLLISDKEKKSISHYLNDLFVEEWLTKKNYTEYFHKCSPSLCSYTISNRTNFSYSITLLISLYGGLILILRLFTPFLVKIFFKFKHFIINHHNYNFLTSLKNNIQFFIEHMKKLNLFKQTNRRTEIHLKQQKISTRVYFIFFLGLSTTLIIYNLINTEIIQITKMNPTLNDYDELQKISSSTCQCPCSNVIISYEKFISFSPKFHEICRSELISEEWLMILEQTRMGYEFSDWRNVAFSHLKFISEMCQISKKTIDDAIDRFLSNPFIVLNLLSQEMFYKQINATFDEFSRSIIKYFHLFIKITQIQNQVDQPYFGPIRKIGMRPENSNPVATFTRKTGSDHIHVEINFQLRGPRYSNSSNCICAIDANCQIPVNIFDFDRGSTRNPISIHRYTAYGIVQGCSTINSVMLSTFECYYNHSGCLSSLLNYSKKTYIGMVENPSRFSVSPLIYHSETSRFPPNTSISRIIDEIMVEQWNPLSSYEQFYRSCSPKSCSYLEKVRAKNVVEVIITFISTISGLRFILRIIIPQMIRLIYYLIDKFKRRREQQEQNRLKRCDRLRKLIIKLFKSSSNHLTNFNIFYFRDFSNKIDQRTAKQLGRYATRLYLILFIGILLLLTLYNFVEKQKFTKIFENLSLNLTKELFLFYKDDIKCPCSSIASSYNWSVEIDTKFHQICSSPFASKEGRNNLTLNLISNLSSYSLYDYRRYLSAHLQYLEELCQLSQETVQISIQQLNSSLFFTPELLIEEKFDRHIERILEQIKFNTAKTLFSYFYLIRSVHHGNGMITTYGTNYKYFNPWNFLLQIHILTLPLIYDDQCSCALSSNCTTQAKFIEENSYEIPGLKIGCLPTESFRLSTLECFYNQTCLNFIGFYVKSPSFNALRFDKTSRFALNTTIDYFINELFIEQWKVTKNYSAYFHQCLPFICLRTIVKRFNFLHSITILLAFQGGLTIVLKWICPKLIEIFYKIEKYRRHRRNTIRPVRNINNKCNTDRDFLSTNDTSSRNVNNSIRCSFKLISLFGLLILLITIVVIYSIRIIQTQFTQTIFTTIDITKHISTDTTSNTIKTTTTTTTRTRRTTLKSKCPFEFDFVVTNRNSSSISLDSHIINDFNGDQNLDIAFLDNKKRFVKVLLGYGNGSFRETIAIGKILPLEHGTIASGYFDNDNHLDIIVLDLSLAFMLIFFGNGTGLFSKRFPKIFIKDFQNPLDMAIGDFNEDKHDDIALAMGVENSVAIFIGNGDGRFSTQKDFYTGLNSFTTKITIVDLNNDNHQDISVLNELNREIGVFLGFGNGSFQELITSFTGGRYYGYSFAFGHFNHDDLIDVVVQYSHSNFIIVMFGFGNGSFSERKKISTGKLSNNRQIYAKDFNGDQIVDIGFGLDDKKTRNILIGDGFGDFDIEPIFSSHFKYEVSIWIGIGDFNNDEYIDIIEVDISSEKQEIFLNKCQ
ncbi:unnamed protein product [Adineta ricciae]|uniref:Uncharacterized protein n=1 Tax=Adineta ricciae TaxID=249248 RepID=A0A814XHC1_ADIRI|nr:unnamed protein product [Adineta ricciae]